MPDQCVSRDRSDTRVLIRTKISSPSSLFRLFPGNPQITVTLFGIFDDDDKKKDDDDDGPDAFATCSRQGPSLSPGARYQALLYHYQSIPHRSHPDS
jgi:hypothetical protein